MDLPRARLRVWITDTEFERPFAGSAVRTSSGGRRSRGRARTARWAPARSARVPLRPAPIRGRRGCSRARAPNPAAPGLPVSGSWFHVRTNRSPCLSCSVSLPAHRTRALDDLLLRGEPVFHLLTRREAAALGAVVSRFSDLRLQLRIAGRDLRHRVALQIAFRDARFHWDSFASTPPMVCPRGSLCVEARHVAEIVTSRFPLPDTPVSPGG